LPQRTVRWPHCQAGERQRAWIAVALVQTPTTLLLDEPTTHLDLGHHWEVMGLLEGLNRQLRATIVLALHVNIRQDWPMGMG
jgi:iron complex transport system ATP-binding protein